MGKSEKIKGWIVRGNPAMSVPVVAAVILFLVFLSGYLPLGNDLTLAAECIHGGGHGRIDEVAMMNKIIYYAKHGNADAALYLKTIRAREHAKREEVRKEG